MRQRTRLSILGFVLGLGSPSGWLLCRILSRFGIHDFSGVLHELVQAKGLYLYLTIGTTLSFSLFGGFAGFLIEKVVHKEKLLEAKTRDYMKIVGFVAHELRTPLTSVRGRLDLTLSQFYGPLNLKVEEALRKALRGCDQISHMISAYLNLARIEQGELMVKLGELDLLMDVIQPVIDELKINLEGCAMHIEVEVSSPGSKYLVNGDPQWLKVAFRNLFANAIRYGYRDTAIRLRLKDLGGKWQIEVYNQGHGIPQGYMGKIFEKFEKVPREGKLSEMGTGLGLYLVREIVQQHEGKIRCESVMNEWANFILEFPKIKVS